MWSSWRGWWGRAPASSVWSTCPTCWAACCRCTAWPRSAPAWAPSCCSTAASQVRGGVAAGTGAGGAGGWAGQGPPAGEAQRGPAGGAGHPEPCCPAGPNMACSAQHAGGRAVAGRRLHRGLQPQDVRPHRHRLPLGQVGGRLLAARGRGCDSSLWLSAWPAMPSRHGGRPPTTSPPRPPPSPAAAGLRCWRTCPPGWAAAR